MKNIDKRKAVHIYLNNEVLLVSYIISIVFTNFWDPCQILAFPPPEIWTLHMTPHSDELLFNFFLRVKQIRSYRLINEL